MTLNSDLIKMVDERIAAAVVKRMSSGTVTIDSTIGSNVVNVQFDGSTQSVPVKKHANFEVLEGDRVSLVKFGADWVVVGTFGNHRIGNTNQTQGTFGTSNTSSTTFVAMDGGKAFSFRKFYEETSIRLRIATQVWTNDAPSTVNTGVDLGAGTWSIAYHVFSQAGHENLSGSRDIPDLPTGLYTATLMWRSIVGTDAMNVNSSGTWTMSAQEIWPPVTA